MRSHREVELKWVLTPSDHERLRVRLVGRLGAPAELDQRNRFLDAADGRMRRAGMSIRLRREGARVLLTCKRKDREHADGLFSHDEWERELDPALWEPALAGDPGLAAALRLPAPHAAALAGADLVCLGGFDNLRLEWHERDEQVCLDRTAFGDGRVDHELEVETPRPEDARARWRAELAALGVAEVPQTTTKFARFLGLGR